MTYDRFTDHRNAKKIKISAGLQEFPNEVLLAADTLEILDISDNEIALLPTDFSRLQNLKVFFCSNNKFASYPEVLADLPNLTMVAFKNNGMYDIPEDALGAGLRWLILTNNNLSRLPDSIGNCQNMQKLMLAGNRLETLPASTESLSRLALLRISNNRIREVPEWLFRMPELAFLAFAGNPCSQRLVNQTHLLQFSDKDLELQDILGEGASGTIYRANCTSLQKVVAVKLFKGAITSDGSPHEMRACLAAGCHPNLIDTIGRLAEGKMQQEGIILELISPSYTILGQPPSLESCSRDCYASGLTFEFDWSLSILIGIASAASHLHHLGIIHGDLYAHNILVNKAGHALLGDFGAATIYSTDHMQDKIVEYLEVKAFGHLVEDLQQRLALERNAWQVTELLKLQQKCQQSDVLKRPDFNSIVDQLKLVQIKNLS